MNHPASIVAPRDRGTVSLVALCFAAVLGISLASYITISSRAMQFSNRSFQAGVSKQLAEVGIEEALRAFSKNDWNGWSSSGITVTWDTATHASNKRATATMSFPTGKFGQGTTATVKIRVDNYDAAHLGASWSSGKNYRINDRVGYNGIWYRCLSAHTSSTSNRPPNLAFWAEAPIPWAWCPNRSYTSNYDIVNHDHDGDGVGTWWRCKNTHTSGSTFDAGKWNSIPYPRLTFTNPTYYGEDTFLFHLNTWYRSKSDQWEWFGFNSSDWDAVSGASTNMPTLSWAYRNAQTYAFNDVVYYNVTWYRCISTSSTGNIPTNTTHWENALSGSMHGWNTSLNYNLGDVVYHSGTSAWYRCIRAHSGQTPSGSSVYWANTPLFSTEWDAGRQYSQNDTVRHNGVWYLSLQNSNAGQNPATATSYWMGANTTNTSYTWSSATSYSVGAYRCYGGVWYRCLSATTANANHTPNNTTYWTSAWSNSWGITTGAPVVYAEATVNIPNNPAQKTQLRALLAPAPLFPNAAGATSDLTITTGTGTVDSYDSKLGAYNQTTSPFTPSAPNVSDSAVLAAAGALAVNGTTHVKGYLAAPSLPANISTSTTVKGSSSPVSPNLAPDRLSRSPYVPQFDLLPVPSGSRLPNPTTWPSNTISIGTPGATTPSIYYYDSDLVVNSDALFITGPVILNIQGALTVSGTNGRIVVTSTGSAEIRFTGRLRVLNFGNCGFDNKTLDPKKLVLWGTSAATNHVYQSTAFNVHAVFYMPNGTLRFDNSPQIHGAISAKKIDFGSAANLHYDTSLRHATFGGVDQPYAVTEWRELPATEQATMP